MLQLNTCAHHHHHPTLSSSSLLPVHVHISVDITTCAGEYTKRGVQHIILSSSMQLIRHYSTITITQLTPTHKHTHPYTLTQTHPYPPHTRTVKAGIHPPHKHTHTPHTHVQSRQAWVARDFSEAVSLRPKRGGAGFLGRRLTLMFSLAPLTCGGGWGGGGAG